MHERRWCLEPARLEKLVVIAGQRLAQAHVGGKEVALLTDASLRRPLRHALARSLAELSVISYQEIPTDLGLQPVALIRPEDVSA